jgi:hypothetical protein
MTGKDLARVLGLSCGMVSKLRKRGMPTDSVEAAMNWRRQNLEPTRTKSGRLDGNPGMLARQPLIAGDAGEELLRWVQSLAPLAERDFGRWGEDLRKAMRMLPARLRERVELKVCVWKALWGAETVWKWQVASEEEFGSDEELSEDERAEVLDLMWKLATGEARWLCSSRVVLGDGKS